MRTIVVLVLTYSFSASGVTWLETTQKDFADGEFDPQLYASFRDGGTVEFFPRFDVNNDGYFDLAAVDFYGPALRLYLGSDSGYYPGNVIIYPISSGGGTDLADLNCDGYAELIHSGYGMGNLSIYWGTPNGPDPNNRTQLPNSNGETVYAADLDKDGHLDLIVAGAAGIIYWGDSTGYAKSRQTTLALPGGACHNIEVGDLNHDGWFDIIIVIAGAPTQPIFYGGPNRKFRNDFLPYLLTDPHGCSIGDLNGDGNLDVVYTGCRTISQSYVYWGTANGPDKNRRLILNPGSCYGGSVLADWNGDGLLDIIYLRGGPPDAYRPGKPLLYLNQGQPPYFSDDDRQEIGDFTFDASGGFIADFDFDGSLDFFMNNISADNSDYLLWGPDYKRTTKLPCFLDHHGTFREPGSIYDRRFRAAYISSVFDAGQIMHRGTLRWQAYTPAYSLAYLRIRSGNTPKPDSTWNDWIGVNNGDSLPGYVTNRRYYQYEALLGYGRPSNLPWLEEVELTLDFQTTGVSIEPDSDAWTLPGQPVDYLLTVTNFGSWPEDTITLSTEKNTAGWQIKLLDSTGTNQIDSLVMASQGKAKIRLRVTSSVQALAFALDTTVVRARSSIDTTSNDDARLITHVRPVASVSVEPDQADSTDPAKAVEYRLRVANQGNGNDTIDLVARRTTVNWQVEFFDLNRQPLYDHNNNGIPDIPSVGPFGYDTVWFIARITPPLTAQPLSRDTTAVWAYSTFDTVSAAGKDWASLFTNIKLHKTVNIDTGVVLALGPHIRAGSIERPNLTISYSLRLYNSSYRDSIFGDSLSGFDTTRLDLPLTRVDLSLTLPPEFSRWHAMLLDSIGNLLTDHNNNGIPDLGPVPAGPAGVTFTVKVTAPESLGYIVGTVDTNNPWGYVFVTARARVDRFEALDSATVRTSLIPPLDIHNYPNPFSKKTAFIFSLPEDGKVTLKIFNRTGELIKRLRNENDYFTGIHTCLWSGENDAGKPVAPGMYLYQFSFTGITSARYKNGTVIIKKAVKVP